MLDLVLCRSKKNYEFFFWKYFNLFVENPALVLLWRNVMTERTQKQMHVVQVSKPLLLLRLRLFTMWSKTLWTFIQIFLQPLLTAEDVWSFLLQSLPWIHTFHQSLEETQENNLLSFKYLRHPEPQQKFAEIQYLSFLLECPLTSCSQVALSNILKIYFFQRLMDSAVKRSTTKHFENSEWCSEASRYNI